MKKEDKIKVFKDAIGTYNYCRCHFKYDPNHFYFYPMGISNKLLLGIEEDDFILNGFQIRRISDLTKIELKDDLCVQINKDNKILLNIEMPNIDLDNWNSVFISLLKMNKYVIVENEDLDEEEQDFAIGKVISVNKTSITFKEFDSSGVWSEKLLNIPFKWITSVTFNDRYSKTWEEYLTKIA